MKLYKNNIARQNLELLIRNERFLKLVSKIRADFNIPDSGFATQKDVANWNENVIKPLKSRDEIQTEIIYGIPIPTKLDGRIKKLLATFRLSLFYANPILGFILYDKLNHRPFQIKSGNVGLSYLFEPDTYPQYKIILEVYPETTQKDILHVWPLVNKMKKHIDKLNGTPETNRNRGMDDLQVALFIWDLDKQAQKSGVKIKDSDIVKKIKQKFPKKTGISYTNVAILRKRIKEKMQEL